MPERLKAILDKITAWWKKFNTKQRSVLISIVAVVIVALHRLSWSRHRVHQRLPQ